MAQPAKRSRVTSSRSKPGAPAPKSSQGGYGHDADRMTKSGRMNLKELKEALGAPPQRTREKKGV